MHACFFLSLLCVFKCLQCSLDTWQCNRIILAIITVKRKFLFHAIFAEDIFVSRLCKNFFFHSGWYLGAVNRDHRTHHRSRLPRYACAIRGIVRRARGYIKAATCWATRILPIRFRRGYILEDEKENVHTSDHDGISRIVRLHVTTPAQFVTRVIDVGLPIRSADQVELAN